MCCVPAWHRANNPCAPSSCTPAVARKPPLALPPSELRRRRRMCLGAMQVCAAVVLEPVQLQARRQLGLVPGRHLCRQHARRRHRLLAAGRGPWGAWGWLAGAGSEPALCPLSSPLTNKHTSSLPCSPSSACCNAAAAMRATGVRWRLKRCRRASAAASPRCPPLWLRCALLIAACLPCSSSWRCLLGSLFL